MEHIDPRDRKAVEELYRTWKVEIQAEGSALISGSTTSVWTAPLMLLGITAQIMIPVLFLVTRYVPLTGAMLWLINISPVIFMFCMVPLVCARYSRISFVLASQGISVRSACLGLKHALSIPWEDIEIFELIRNDLLEGMRITVHSGDSLTLDLRRDRFVVPPLEVWRLLLHDVAVPEPAHAMLLAELERCERLMALDGRVVKALPVPPMPRIEGSISDSPDKVVVRSRGCKTIWPVPVAFVGCLGLYASSLLYGPCDEEMSGPVRILLAVSVLLLVLVALEVCLGLEEIGAVANGVFVSRRGIFGRRVRCSQKRPTGVYLVERRGLYGNKAGLLVIETEDGQIELGRAMDIAVLRWLSLRLSAMWGITANSESPKNANGHPK